MKSIKSTRDWVEKYRISVQNEEIIKSLNFEPIQESGPWSFLKLAFLWCFAQTYTNIIGGNYKNILYADLFSGCGLSKFKDSGEKDQFLLGSPVLMASISFKYPFTKCFFFEENQKYCEALNKRLEILKNRGEITAREFKLIPGDCNINIEAFIKEISQYTQAHFLLFVDPYSTEIKWKTMEKLLSLKFPSPSFDMIFNFQPFGINRKSSIEEISQDFFPDEEYKKYLKDKNVLQLLEDYYIENLKKQRMVKTVRAIRIESGGSGGFYYDLIYTTRKSDPPWIPAVEHIGKMVEKLTGRQISIIVDPSRPPLFK